MNDEVRDIIMNITKSPTLLACLQLAELVECEDFVDFSQTSISILEKYIQGRTSIMDLNNRKLYLSDEFLHYPDKFLFTPGIRNRLLKAAKQISGSVSFSCHSNKSDTVDSHLVSSDTNQNSATHYENFAPFTTIAPATVTEDGNMALNFCKVENQFLSSPPCNLAGPLRPEIIDRVRHLNCLDKYYSDISKNAHKNFVNCFLEPKRHFQITIPDDDPTNLIGLYHCNLCFDRRKTPTVIKFRFSKYNSVLYTNINSHLKIHFQYIVDTPERKRIKLSKSLTIENGGLSHDVNGIMVNKLEFES